MSKDIDQNIWNRAEETAKADHPHATEDHVRMLAEAWQAEYENWAALMELAPPANKGWRNPDCPCHLCWVSGCDCQCPTCRKAEDERAAGTRTRSDDLTNALDAALGKDRKQS